MVWSFAAPTFVAGIKILSNRILSVKADSIVTRCLAGHDCAGTNTLNLAFRASSALVERTF